MNADNLLDWASGLTNWELLGLILGAVAAALGIVGLLAKGMKNCINGCLKVINFFSQKIKDKKTKREYLKLYSSPQQVGEDWAFFPHEDSPRFPVCRQCTRPGEPAHMEKVPNKQHCRQWPVKWSYYCSKCNTTQPVENKDCEGLMKCLGQRWP